MSYILEALKKAEAQRGQGQVPGIHDQHMAPEFSTSQAREGQSLLIWIIMAMGLVMIGLLVWALWQPGGTNDAVSAAPMPALVNTAPANTAPAPTPTPAPAPQAPPALPPVAESPAPNSTRADPAAITPATSNEPAPNPPAARAPTPDRAIQPRRERKATNESSPGTAPTAEATRGKHKPPAAASEELPDLPEAMRAQLPKLAFGGAMHSDNAASRMLIVNGQLLHEGDAISPDLTLERIQLKQATFRYKGYRYTAQY